MKKNNNDNGLDRERLDHLRAAIEEDIANDRYFGAVITVARHGVPGLSEAIGYADAEHQRKLEIDSVFSLDVATRIAPDGSVITDPYIEKSGLWIAPNGKTNVGLGKPRCKEV